MIMWLFVYNLIFIIPIALCDTKEPCELSDEACLLPAHKIVLKAIILGNPILNIKSSDPLHQDKIEAFLPHMNITLTDPYMYGTLSCETQKVKIDSGKWLLTLFCKKMTLESDYEINGDVDSVHIEGKGKCKIIYDKYVINMSGDYEIYADIIGLDHFNITSYQVDSTEVQGRVIYNFDNLFDGDKEKSSKAHEYINENWMKLHDIISKPIAQSLFGYLVRNVNEYLVIVPKLQLFIRPPSLQKPISDAVHNIISLF